MPKMKSSKKVPNVPSWDKPLRTAKWWQTQVEPIAFYLCLIRIGIPFTRTQEEQAAWINFQRHLPKAHRFKAAGLASSVADSMLNVRKNKRQWQNDYEALLALELPDYLKA